ncbi:MAG: hypothetical protein ACXWUL_08565 [Caldimonas sp.]
MIGVVASIAARIAACTLLSWLAWRWLGLTALVTTLPLFGVALARPLLELASELGHQMRRGHWRDVEGRHYAYRGRPVRVVEDGEHRRWVRLADIRAIAGFTASDGALGVSYPGAVLALGRPPQPHLRDDALLAHLHKERSPEALGLCRWVEREIVFPARRERERLGVGAPGPEPPEPG